MEAPLERAVSDYLAQLSYLAVEVSDDPGPRSLRGTLERNSIALLSNSSKPPLDPPSPHWLGRFSNRHAVVASGLWNQRHVTEEHDADFVSWLTSFIGCSVSGKSHANLGAAASKDPNSGR
jgi:hypothetical protein